MRSKLFDIKTTLLFVFIFSVILFSARAGDLKFIIWGDSQFHNPEKFESIVKETELLKPGFVVHVGDMIHGYTYDPAVARREWKRFKKQIAPLSSPFYPTPGNHDVTTPEIEPVYGEIWGNDKYYYSFNHDNIHFIVLDVFYRGKFNDISGDQLEWFKKDLEKNKNADNIFISLHAPLHLSDKFDWNPIHAMIKKYPVRAVFTGHSHIYDYRKKDGIDYFCLNSSGGMRMYSHLLGHSHHYLIVSVNGKKIDYAVVEGGRIYPADAASENAYTECSLFLKDEQTILIPDTSQTPLDMNIRIPVENKTGTQRKIALEWKSKDFRWEFAPRGAILSLNPGEKVEKTFRIKGPKGIFNREEFPRLCVSSVYENQSGFNETIRYSHRLFSPPEIKAEKLQNSIKFDGIIDDIAWNSTPAIKELYIDSKGTTSSEKTIIKTLYDREHLYVGIWGEEPNPANLSDYANGEIPLVFGDDDFEIYLDTNRDLKTFYRMMVNPKRITLSSGPDGLYSFKFQVKTHVGDSDWSAEFKIPFSELKTDPPKEGDIWGFNVRRHRQQSSPSRSDWSWMRNFPYQPQYFGLLRFD
jgi:predicted phosphodiesterase